MKNRSVWSSDADGATSYGGGAGIGSVLDGDISMNLRDPRASKVYGGSYKADVNGDVAISLAGNARKVGNVHAGGFKWNVKGDAVLQFADSAALASYARTIDIASEQVQYARD